MLKAFITACVRDLESILEPSPLLKLSIERSLSNSSSSNYISSFSLPKSSLIPHDSYLGSNFYIDFSSSSFYASNLVLLSLIGANDVLL